MMGFVLAMCLIVIAALCRKIANLSKEAKVAWDAAIHAAQQHATTEVLLAKCREELVCAWHGTRPHPFKKQEDGRAA